MVGYTGEAGHENTEVGKGRETEPVREGKCGVGRVCQGLRWDGESGHWRIGLG